MSINQRKSEMSTGQQVRRVAAPVATGVAGFVIERAASGQEFDLLQFLLYLGTTAGAGAAVFAIIEYGEKLARTRFSSVAKFYAAQALSYVLPVGAYLLTVQFSWQEWSVGLLLAAAATGYQVSQIFHFETDPPPTP